MKKPTIAFYREQKPAHYVGADCSITINHKSDIEKWQIDAIESMFTSVLGGCDYDELENSEGFEK